MTRAEKLQELKRYFCSELAEDKIDGTAFDCAVIDTIEDLEDDWNENE